MQPTIQVQSKQNDARLRAALEKIARTQVLVGIPAAKSARHKGKLAAPGTPAINNAQLLYIHTNGSPVNHIPPRPVIEPAIADSGNKPLITEELGLAARAYLNQQPGEAKMHLQKAGQLGMGAARLWFLNPKNGWAPNAPRTIALKGSSQPLIDLGEMRRAITFVLVDHD